MKLLLRILILAIAIVTAVAISRGIWLRTIASPAQLRIHVSFLAFGYTLFVGVALQAVARILGRDSTPEFWPMTVFRLLANLAATTGYGFGILWAIQFQKYGALYRPVLISDSMVIILAWSIAVRPLRIHSLEYWDTALGLGTLISWYLSTLQ